MESPNLHNPKHRNYIANSHSHLLLRPNDLSVHSHTYYGINFSHILFVLIMRSLMLHGSHIEFLRNFWVQSPRESVHSSVVIRQLHGIGPRVSDVHSLPEYTVTPSQMLPQTNLHPTTHAQHPLLPFRCVVFEFLL